MLSTAEIEQLPSGVKQHISALTHRYGTRISEQELEIEDLQARLKLALFRKFGRSSEASSGDLQALLFEELEEQAKDESKTEVQLTTVSLHTRKKRGRKPLADDLP